MAHTQGQWEVLPGKDATGDETLCIRGNGEFIATMDVVSIDGAPYRLPDNGEANARLIAAAPELLAECEEAERALRWAAQEAKGKVRAEVVGGWLHRADRVKAAIAKAKGL